MLRPYIPIVLVTLFVIGNAVLLVGLSHLLSNTRRTAPKDTPYESGMPVLGTGHERFSVKFYLVAMLFIIFDIEVVFLIPLAFIYRDFLANNIAILTPILFFLFVLVLGLVYEVKKGALEWER